MCIRDRDEIIQDWSQLTKLVRNNKSFIPKRGEKDYEPDGTNIQDQLLNKAKENMFNVLHNSSRGSILRNQVKAYYNLKEHNAAIFQPKGTFAHTMGTPDSNGSLILSFHEFVYLAERGTVSPFIITKCDEDTIELPLSIEDVYTLFFSQEELDEFSVYAYLKRMGFVVLATSLSYGKRASLYYNNYSSAASRKKSVFNHMLNFFDLYPCRIIWPLISRITFPLHFIFAKYTSSSQIYESINHSIPYYSPSKTIQELRLEHAHDLTSIKSEYKIAFDVWKPSPSFKKSRRCLPDFQIVIHNKNNRTKPFPDLYDFKSVFQQLDHKFDFLCEADTLDELLSDDQAGKSSLKIIEAPQKHMGKDKKIEDTRVNSNSIRKKTSNPTSAYNQKMRRIRNGYKSFLLAVIDDGLISMIKISETDFGSENIWYVTPSNMSPSKGSRTKKKKTK